MPDQISTLPAPAPPLEPPTKSAGQRAEINQAWLDEISGTEKLAVVAAKDACKAWLAKRKFTGEMQTLREAYFVRAGLSGRTLDEVLTASRSVLPRLSPGDGNAPPQDVLPGITAAGRIQELADAITTYGGKDQAQGAKQTEAGKLLEAIKANVPKLAKLRRQVQLAADQAWPWRTPGVATIRKAFLLSPDRPMKD